MWEKIAYLWLVGKKNEAIEAQLLCNFPEEISKWSKIMSIKIPKKKVEAKKLFWVEIGNRKSIKIPKRK